MSALFLRYFNVGLGCGLFILAFWLCAPLIDRHWAAGWKRAVWLLLTLRLLLPFELRLFRPRVLVSLPPAGAAPMGAALPLPPAPGAAAPAAAAPAAPFDWLGLLALVWLAGAALSLVLCAAGYVRCRRLLLEQGRPVRDPALSALLAEEARALGIRRPPRLLVWPGCGSPMVLGFLRPLLALPGEDPDPEELRLIFRHELCHIRRGDLFLKALMAAAKALHWFDPLVRLLPRLAELDLELACDDRAAALGPRDARRAYAEALLHSLQRQADRPQTAALAYTTQFYGGKALMKKRLKNILSGPGKKRGLSLLLLAGLLLAALGGVAACGDAPEEPAEIPVRETAFPETDGAALGDTAIQFIRAAIQAQEEQLEKLKDQAFSGGTGLEGIEPSYKMTAVPPEELTGDGQAALDSPYPVSVKCSDEQGELLAEIRLQAVKREEGWRILSCAPYYTGDGGWSVPVATSAPEPGPGGEDGSAPVVTAAPEPVPVEEQDRANLENMANAFATAYFLGDETVLRSYLTEDFAFPVELYEGPSALDPALQLREDLPLTMEEGTVCPLSVRFTTQGEDSATFLSLSAVKTAAGWRVQFYGLEK